MQRLQQLLGGPMLAPVRERLRRHFRSGAAKEASAALRLSGLDAATHAALGQLTGQPARAARSLSLDIAALDQRLRDAGLADSLRDALERLDGPIIDHAALRDEARSQWQRMIDSVETGACLRAWLSTPQALKILKRTARDPATAQTLLAAADRILRRLPLGGTPRSQLAAQSVGDAHALDAGRPLARLVLAAWIEARPSAANRGIGAQPAPDDAGFAAAHRSGAPDENGVQDSLRDAWASAGVLVNELARPCLCLNLPAPSAPMAWTPGEPHYLSLRTLMRNPLQWSLRGRAVFVCENPNVVAIAADRLGAGCAPLLCTEGMPSAAQRTLLSQLVDGGAQLHYHGDFDWPGIRIANHVFSTWPALPWRLGVDDYLDAAGRWSDSPHGLEGKAVVARWDADLLPAMQRYGIAVAEEAMVDPLLQDLQAG